MDHSVNKLVALLIFLSTNTSFGINPEKNENKVPEIFIFNQVDATCYSLKDPKAKGYNIDTFGPCSFVKYKNMAGKTLNNINLSGSQLFGIRFYTTHLSKIHGSHFMCKQCELIDTKIKNIFTDNFSLIGSQLNKVIFQNFSFKNANLSGVTIKNSRFSGGDFIGANFEKAYIADTQFINAILPINLKKQATLINVTFENCRFQ